MPGITLYQDISGSLDAKNIVLGVLEKGVQLSNLASILGTTVQVPKLDATIPVMTGGAVREDVDEMEHTDIEGGAFTQVTFSLKKDRVTLMVSDEARHRSMAGDPLALQKQGTGAQLARILDKKIALAHQVTPQTSGAAGLWSTITVNPLADLGVAAAAILPYKADYVIMPSNVWAKYMANDFVKNVATGNPPALAGALAKVPGLNLDIFINNDITAKSCIVGATNGYATVLGQGPVDVKTEESMDGGTIYQMDVFRQVKSTIFKTGGDLNMSAYQLTEVIA